MMLHIPAVLSKLQVAELRQQLDTSEHWINGQLSAGSQAQKIKKNLQLDSSSALKQQISTIILEAHKKDN